ncbi:hypothetical protein N7476_008948 [Penicillium atrosanguineum]|uniref:Uncharacterized protein n=1 Tax=Penicillium atrosanguineum TaxID=1132637 RepID=A0A9W9PSJ6_9EURO|nr:hypothetical protein N7476_008948 [Penicillium atrosanguineum]
MQLYDPQPLQITLQALPVDYLSSDCLKDIEQKLHLNWIKFNVLSTAAMIASNSDGFWSNKLDHTCWQTIKMGTISPSGDKNELLVLSTGTKAETIYIGDVLQLTLYENGLKVGNNHASSTMPIVPDFTTYGIKHYNQRDWELSLIIAGETVDVNFNEKLKIMPAP